MYKLNRVMRLFVFTACILFAAVCGAEDHADDEMLKAKLGLFNFFEPNLALPLPARVQTISDDFLKSIIEFDRSSGIRNTDYKARIVSPADIALFAEYVKLLPRRYQATLSKKLLAVYFVDHFSGAGLTDWVVDEKGEFYYYMILNSALIAQSLDDWLTYRENAYFEGDAESFSINVRTGTKYKALLYGLLHEGGHILDYEYNVTPYIDPLHKKLIKTESEVSAFTRNVWVQQKQPVAEYDFQNRDNLNVYGIFADKPLLPAGEMAEMFARLSKTPFVSFYGGVTWYEDFADFITYHHIEKNLDGSIVLELIHNGKVVDRYLPARQALNKEKKAMFRKFYK